MLVHIRTRNQISDNFKISTLISNANDGTHKAKNVTMKDMKNGINLILYNPETGSRSADN